MIPPKKQAHALYALEGLLVHARSMAAERAPFKDLYDFLDAVQELPSFLAGRTDDTEAFRRRLVEISQRFRCEAVLKRFDDPVPPAW